MALSLPPDQARADPENKRLQGWQPDGLGRFEQRYYLDGDATYLVRNGDVESFDEPIDELPNPEPQPEPMVTIPVVPIGKFSRPVEPIVIPAAGLEPRNPPAIESPEIVQLPAAAAPRLSTYPPEYAPPPNSSPAYQSPIYASSTYTAQLVFAQLLSDVESAPPTAVPAVEPEVDPKPPVTETPPVSEPPASNRSRVRLSIAIAAGVLVVAGVVAGVTAIVTSSGSPAGRSRSTSADGGVFTSQIGHFRARFPSPPTELNVPASGTGSVQFNLQGAWCTSPITEIAAETAAAAVPKDQQEAALQLALASFANTVPPTGAGQVPTTYSGHAGRTGTFKTSGGTQLTAMVFFYSDTRLYIIVAPTGSAFDDLVASFVPLA